MTREISGYQKLKNENAELTKDIITLINGDESQKSETEAKWKVRLQPKVEEVKQEEATT